MTGSKKELGKSGKKESTPEKGEVRKRKLEELSLSWRSLIRDSRKKNLKDKNEEVHSVRRSPEVQCPQETTTKVKT